MADPLAVQLLRNAKSTRVRMVSGLFVGMIDNRAAVSFDGGQVPAYLACPMPAQGEAVWVLVVDAVSWVLGPAGQRATSGTVVTASTGVATVTGNTGETVTAQYPASMMLSAGAVVALIWSAGYWVLGVTTPAPAPAAPPPQPAPVTRTQTFTATGSASYEGSRRWTTDVYSSASNRGVWVYGSKIADTIPNGAKITSGAIWLPAPKRVLGGRPFGHHPWSSLPSSGTPVISDQITLQGTSGWQPLNATILNFLKSNRGGVGFDLGGYNIWPGVPGQSGAIRITYTY